MKSKEDDMVNLGDRVRDHINGFEGIVTGRAEYLYGCVQVLVVPERLGENGKLVDSLWLDDGRVNVIEAAVLLRPASADERAGGPLTNAAPPVR